MPEPVLVSAPIAGVGDGSSEGCLPIVGAPDLEWNFLGPDGDRPPDAGGNVPTDENVLAALVRRSTREGVVTSDALASERSPAEAGVGFPGVTATTVGDAKGRNPVMDAPIDMAPCPREVGPGDVVQAKESPEGGLKLTGHKDGFKGCHGWERRENKKSKGSSWA